MTRRRVRRPLATLGVAGGLLLGLAAGGGLPGTPAHAGHSPASASEDDRPIDRDATLRIGTVTMTLDWDPHKEVETGQRKMLWAIWDRLLMLDGDAQLVPGVATEWGFADDGSYLELKLRDDVTFHDGTPVTADAVTASLERAKTLEGSTAAIYLAPVASVEAVDDHTVRLHIEGAAAFLPFVLATSVGAVINPQSIADGVDIGADPNDASSGGYVLEDFVPRESAVLVRAEGDYWDPDAQAAARIEFRNFGPDAQAGIAAIRTGELDYLTVLSDPATTAASLAGSDVVHEVFPTAGLYGFWLNPNIEPTNDPLVRQAILQGSDRMLIGEGVGGDPSYATLQYALPGALGYVEGYEPFPYDPEAARAALEEAGYGDGLTIELIHPAGYAPAEISALAVQEQLAQIGIEVIINPLVPSDFTPAFYTLEYPAAITATGAEADPYSMLDLRFNGGSSLLADEAVDEFVAAMAAAADQTNTPEQRQTAYEHLTVVALDQGTWAPIGFRPGQTVASARLIGALDQPGLLLSDTANIPRYLAIAAE